MRERTSARHAHHRRKSRAVYAVMLLGISLFIGLVATNSRSSSDTNTNRTSATTFSFAETNPDANSSSLELVDTAAAASSVSLADKPFHIRDVPGGGSDAPTTVQFRGAVYTRNDVPVAEHLLPAYTRAWWIDLVGTLVCILIAALAAGLTVGLVSIDPFDLAVIQTTEEADCSTAEEIAELREEKVYADKLMPLVQRHHLLLVTLLIMNSFANEVLPLLLDNLVPSWLAIVLSVSAVLLFGEILPSSIFVRTQTMSMQCQLASPPAAAAHHALSLACLLSLSFSSDRSEAASSCGFARSARVVLRLLPVRARVADCVGAGSHARRGGRESSSSQRVEVAHSSPSESSVIDFAA